MVLQAGETSFFEATLHILPPDSAMVEVATNKFFSVVMPLYGPGVLRGDLIRMAGIQETVALCLGPRKLFVFCADNGIARREATQAGQGVTTTVCERFAYGGSTVSRMTALADCAVISVGMGTAGESRGKETLQ